MLKHNGLLSYRGVQGAREVPSKVLYNTVVTPRGGTYEVLLADGSKAWLNAASSLRFPTSFQGKSREVTLTGEAYFEITDKASQPFIVHISSAEGTSKGEVQVLGTHFNINAYDDESVIRTTLLEGNIRVTGGQGSLALAPGEEADLDKSGAVNHHCQRRWLGVAGTALSPTFPVSSAPSTQVPPQALRCVPHLSFCNDEK